MNKKLKYALIIIGLILALALVTLYIIFPTEFKATADYIWQKVNEPLPVVGVSLLVIAYATYKAIKYVRQTHPSKELREMREEHNKYVADSEKEKQELKEQNNELSKMGAENLSYMELKKGQVLFRIGDSGDKFYFILKI